MMTDRQLETLHRVYRFLIALADEDENKPPVDSQPAATGDNKEKNAPKIVDPHYSADTPQNQLQILKQDFQDLGDYRQVSLFEVLGGEL